MIRYYEENGSHSFLNYLCLPIKNIMVHIIENTKNIKNPISLGEKKVKLGERRHDTM